MLRQGWSAAHHAALVEVMEDVCEELQDTEEGQQAIAMLPSMAGPREGPEVLTLSLWEMMECVVKDDVATLMYADAASSLDKPLQAVPLHCPYLNMGDTLRTVAQRFPAAVWSRRYIEWADARLSNVLQRNAESKEPKEQQVKPHFFTCSSLSYCLPFLTPRWWCRIVRSSALHWSTTETPLFTCSALSYCLFAFLTPRWWYRIVHSSARHWSTTDAARTPL